MPIHPTAIVDAASEVSPSADIGAYAVIEGNCTIGEEARIYPHAYVSSGTTLGPRVQVHPFAMVGHHPQDFAWDRSPSYTVIGADTVIREHASIHRGTEPESVTRVGEHTFVMAMAHIAHNCQVGSHVILTSAVLLGGRIHVGDRAVFGARSGAHQFCRIGKLAMIAGGAEIRKDVPPFMMVGHNGIIGINAVGLRRNGIEAAERLELKRCYHVLARGGGPLSQRIAQLHETAGGDCARHLVDWLREPSKRGVLTYTRKGGDDDEA